MRETVNPPQTLADEHTLLAQKYAGFFVGHPYRNAQQTPNVVIDRRRRWQEPIVVADDCVFCQRLTDEEAERRVAGYQHQLDIEGTRVQRSEYYAWVRAASPDVPEPGIFEESVANLRRFCELFQDTPGKDGWSRRPLPLIALPLRLKRKLCIEWNHLYRDWMAKNGLQYDFETHKFCREVSDRSSDEEDR